MDLSEELKRIYRYLDSLQRLAESGQPVPADDVKTIGANIRGYVDSIAEQVDYETDEDDDDEETDDDDGLDMLMGSRPDDEE